jgi:hypothetical protein
MESMMSSFHRWKLSLENLSNVCLTWDEKKERAREKMKTYYAQNMV